MFDTALGKGTTPKNQNKKVNFDTILDFHKAEDVVWLDNKIFKKLGKAGSEAAPAALNKKFFKAGAKPKDRDDYLVYDNKTGIVLRCRWVRHGVQGRRVHQDRQQGSALR